MVLTYTYIHTHTHTHIYIYIYMYVYMYQTLTFPKLENWWCLYPGNEYWSTNVGWSSASCLGQYCGGCVQHDQGRRGLVDNATFTIPATNISPLLTPTREKSALIENIEGVVGYLRKAFPQKCWMSHWAGICILLVCKTLLVYILSSFSDQWSGKKQILFKKTKKKPDLINR